MFLERLTAVKNQEMLQSLLMNLGQKCICYFLLQFVTKLHQSCKIWKAREMQCQILVLNMNIASEMAELHTNDLTNLRLMKSHFLFHEIFLQLLSFLMKMTAMMAAARRVRNARRESTKMSTLISSTRISTGHSGRLVAPSSCKMGRHVTQPRKSSNGLMIILGSLFFHGLLRVLI